MVQEVYNDIMYTSYVYGYLQQQLNNLLYCKRVLPHNPIIMDDMVGNIELKIHLAMSIISQKMEHLEELKAHL